MGAELWKRQIIYNFHIYRHCFVVFSLSPWLAGNQYDLAFAGLTLYCCSYAMCIILLTYHFVYRYLLICRPQQMYIFSETKNFIWWYVNWAFWAVAWALIVRATMYHWPELENYVYDDLMLQYNFDSRGDAILGPLYFLDDPNGSKIISWRAFLGSGCCMSIMGFCFTTILFCAVNVYKKLKSCSVMSEKTRKMQWDLFKALLVQFSLPAVCEFFPGGMNFLCPVFALPIGRWANFAGIIASFNNIIEPLCMLYFVKDYRFGLWHLLGLNRKDCEAYTASAVHPNLHDFTEKIMPNNYTLTDVQSHTTEDSLWIIIKGKVYDVTLFLDEHPGGRDVLMEQAGQDATEAFEDIGHSGDAKEMLNDYYIGDLVL
ncbi:unnamed protein product, partial [Mesorhabditis spiculigera]